MNKFATAKRHAELHQYNVQVDDIHFSWSWFSQIDEDDWTHYGTGRIYFRNEEDKVKFILRWG